MTAPDPGLVARVAVMSSHGPEDVARAAATWLADMLDEKARHAAGDSAYHTAERWAHAANAVRRAGGVS